jgi:hypothetical protein
MSNKFLFEIRIVYEIMWQNMVEPDVAENMQFSCWIIHAKILCYFFPRPQWSRERAFLLHCTCTSRLAELSRCIWRYIPLYLLVNSVYNYVTIMIYTYNDFFLQRIYSVFCVSPLNCPAIQLLCSFVSSLSLASYLRVSCTCARVSLFMVLFLRAHAPFV